MEKKSQKQKEENFQNLPENPISPSPEERKRNKWTTDIYGDEVLVLPLNSVDQAIAFMTNNKEFVFPYILDIMARAIENNRDRIQYLKVGSTPYMIEIGKDNLEASITTIIDFFVEEEMYEEAARATNMIDRHRANMLMDLI